ncbi:MAG: acyl carrier protein [Nocardioides sp.]|uniref:acyl carrier protein n=1 Tax=Nocardioides sp. TaxID=35761 RepID=UPI0039E69627
MQTLDRAAIRDLMAQVLSVQGAALPAEEADAVTALGDIGFRSLDFSELALRVEDEIGGELNFEAAGLRAVRTVADVLDLMVDLQAAP